MAALTDSGVPDREPALTPSSDYIVYLDESGDHSLDAIDRHYPIFVLSACVFRKADYSAVVVPSFLNLKFRFFGHDMVVLHSRDIRKAQGAFSILQNAQVRQDFLAAVDAAVADAPFTLVTAIIDKRRLTRQSDRSDNPYEIALTFCMEQVFSYLQGLQQHQVTTSMIVECRGKKEDADLELSFLRTAQGNNIHGLALPFEIVFADKKTNSTGLQLADLVSYPIGRQHLNPAQPNQAYDVVESKFRRGPSGLFDGWGRKVLP
jgi:hypothetical protein